MTDDIVELPDAGFVPKRVCGQCAHWNNVCTMEVPMWADDLLEFLSATVLGDHYPLEDTDCRYCGCFKPKVACGAVGVGRDA